MDKQQSKVMACARSALIHSPKPAHCIYRVGGGSDSDWFNTVERLDSDWLEVSVVLLKLWIDQTV